MTGRTTGRKDGRFPLMFRGLGGKQRWEFWEITEVLKKIVSWNTHHHYTIYVAVWWWIRNHQCLPWRVNDPSFVERFWSQEAQTSRALPSTRNVLFHEAWWTAVFSSLPLSVCSHSVGIRAKNLVHKSNQTPTHLTINLAKHCRGAFNLSPLWAPLLSQHCSIEAQ